MKEYWNKPDLTKQALTPDFWFRTGDVAIIDKEGYIYIVDRIKDIIIRGKFISIILIVTLKKRWRKYFMCRG